MTGKYLITCDSWFIAPDGKSYMAVWGDCKTITSKEALGFDPNRNSANWFVEVTNNGESVLLAGCQIHYAVSCKERPNTKPTEQNYDDRGKVVRDTRIYIPGDMEKVIEEPSNNDRSVDAIFGKLPGAEVDFKNTMPVMTVEKTAEAIIFTRNPKATDAEFIKAFREYSPECEELDGYSAKKGQGSFKEFIIKCDNHWQTISNIQLYKDELGEPCVLVNWGTGSEIFYITSQKESDIFDVSKIVENYEEDLSGSKYWMSRDMESAKQFMENFENDNPSIIDQIIDPNHRAGYIYLKDETLSHKDVNPIRMIWIGEQQGERFLRFVFKNKRKVTFNLTPF